MKIGTNSQGLELVLVDVNAVSELAHVVVAVAEARTRSQPVAERLLQGTGERALHPARARHRVAAGASEVAASSGRHRGLGRHPGLVLFEEGVLRSAHGFGVDVMLMVVSVSWFSVIKCKMQVTCSR